MSEKRLFGTDGVRGKANTYPMTAEMALSLGQALALSAFRIGSRWASAGTLDGRDMIFASAAAMWAHSAIRPTLSFKVLAGGVFGLKNWGI